MSLADDGAVAVLHVASWDRFKGPSCDFVLRFTVADILHTPAVI